MKRKKYSYWFAFYDFLAAFVAWLIFYFERKSILHEAISTIDLTLILNASIVSFYWLILYFLSGFYVDIFRKSRVKELFIMFFVCVPGVLFVFLILLLDDEGVINYKSYYKTLSAYFFIHFLIAASLKMIILTYTKRLLKRGVIQFNTLIIGANQKADELFEELSKINYSLGMRFVGFLNVVEYSSGVFGDKLRHFGNVSVLGKVIRRCRIENVIIAIEPSEHEKVASILSDLRDFDVKVSVIPDMYHVLLGSVKVNHLLGVPLIEIEQKLLPIWQKVVKRGFDIVFSVVVLLIGFPAYLFIAVMTKLSSSGPVFFTQERIGKNKKTFNIIKFRSMYVDSEKKGPALSSDDDPRITPWGKVMRKTRLDELPQFFNVIKGDMSVVGPRPERQFFIDQIVQVAPQYRHLLKVKPGITSLGQVKYGYAENVSQMVKRLEYDILYIENMSLAMDFRIILYTILIVIQRRGK